jgi:cell division topological specificity factor
LDMMKLFGTKDDNGSKTTAKERLKLVLVHDRANVSPQFLDSIKDELMAVISDYIEIDENGFDIRLTKTQKDDDTMVPALVANIPIKRMKNIGRGTRD